MVVSMFVFIVLSFFFGGGVGLRIQWMHYYIESKQTQLIWQLVYVCFTDRQTTVRAVLTRAWTDTLQFDEGGSTHDELASHWLLDMNTLNAMTLVRLYPGM